MDKDRSVDGLGSATIRDIEYDEDHSRFSSYLSDYVVFDWRDWNRWVSILVLQWHSPTDRDDDPIYNSCLQHFIKCGQGGRYFRGTADRQWIISFRSVHYWQAPPAVSFSSFWYNFTRRYNTFQLQRSCSFASDSVSTACGSLRISIIAVHSRSAISSN